MSIKTADDLFLNHLKELYSAEKEAIHTYPRIAKKISSADLRDVVEQHLEQTKGQLERLDRVFEGLEKKPGSRTCEAMKGLLDEASEQIDEIKRGPLLDAALIGALQRMEHYEIASYGTVVALAEAMEHDEIQKLLQQTLDEEKQTDEKLTEVARDVNQDVIQSEEEDEEDDEDQETSEDDDDESDGVEEEEESSSSKKSAGRKASARKSGAKGSR